MDPKPTIRPAVLPDLSTVTAIYAEAVRRGTASYELEPPDRTEMIARWRSTVESGYPYFVAEAGGSVLGYAYANAFRTRPAYRFLVEDSIYIAADARGTGIGSLLLAQLIHTCETGPYRQMVAVIGDGDHQRASIALHQKYGFRSVGSMTATGYKFGRWLDTLIMQRALGNGATTDPG